MADNKTDIGNGARVLARHERERPRVDEHAGCHFGHGEGLRKLLRMNGETGGAKRHDHTASIATEPACRQI